MARPEPSGSGTGVWLSAAVDSHWDPLSGRDYVPIAVAATSSLNYIRSVRDVCDHLGTLFTLRISLLFGFAEASMVMRTETLPYQACPYAR